MCFGKVGTRDIENACERVDVGLVILRLDGTV